MTTFSENFELLPHNEKKKSTSERKKKKKKEGKKKLEKKKRKKKTKAIERRKMSIKLIVLAIVMMGVVSQAERIPHRFEVGGSTYWWYYARFEVYPAGTDCSGKPEGAMLFVETLDPNGGNPDISMLICGARNQNQLNAGGEREIMLGSSDSARPQCLVTPSMVKLLPIDFTEADDYEAAMTREREIAAFKEDGNKLCSKLFGSNARLGNAGDLINCFDSNAPQLDNNIAIAGGAANVWGIHAGRVWAQTPRAADSRQWAYSTACADGNRCTGYVQHDGDCDVDQVFEEDGELKASVSGTRDYVPGTDPDLHSSKADYGALLCVRSNTFASHPLDRRTNRPAQNTNDCGKWNSAAFVANQPKAMAQFARGAGYGKGGSNFYHGVNNGGGAVHIKFELAGPLLFPLEGDKTQCYDFLSCDTRVPVPQVPSK
jgi:hypothetical protein